MRPVLGGALLLIVSCAPCVTAAAADVQQVEGTVSVRGQVRVAEPVGVAGRVDASRLVSFEDVLVPPLPSGSGPADVERLVSLGTVDASGFRTALACVVGWYPAKRPTSGELVLLLVPDVTFVAQAHESDGVILLDERVTVALGRQGERWFSGTAPRFDLRFPRYRAYACNTSAQSVRVSAYVHVQD